MARFEIAFGNWVVRQRWWIIAAAIAVTVAAASGVRFITFNAAACAWRIRAPAPP